MSNDNYSIGRFSVEFVERLIARDNDAWIELQERLGDRLMQIARNRGLDHQAAEDAVQETLLSVYKAIDSSRGRDVDLQPAYFIAALIRKCYAHSKRRSQSPIRSDADLSSLRMDSDAEERLLTRIAVAVHPSGEASLEDRELIALVLGRLKDHERELLVLRFVDEMTLKELAERLGVPLGTVNSRIERAIKRLLGLFGDEYGRA